jgi:hypothetical protein
MAKSFNVASEFLTLDVGFEAIQQMQYQAVGGSLRPDQAVNFILKSEKIRMSMMTQIMNLSRLIEQAEEGKIGE